MKTLTQRNRKKKETVRNTEMIMKRKRRREPRLISKKRFESKETSMLFWVSLVTHLRSLRLKLAKHIVQQL